MHEKAHEDEHQLVALVLLGPRQGALKEKLPTDDRLIVLSKPLKMKDVQESIHRLQLPCGSQSFEAIDQFPAAFVSNDHDRRKLTIALQRAHHAAFEFGNVKTVSAVSFSDLVQPQFLRLLFSPAQHGCLQSKKRETRAAKQPPQFSIPLAWSR